MRRRLERAASSRVAQAIAVGVVYYLTARLSLRLALVGESVTPLWPPTGIALVGFLWFGRAIWPGVAVAAFLVNVPISPNAGAAAGIAAGNTLAPLLARRLLMSVRFRVELDRLRDALALVSLGALVSMALSAGAGTVSLLASGAIEATDFWSTWSVWWTGDAMGVLAVAPFLLSLRLFRLRGAPPFVRTAEAAVLLTATVAVASTIQRTDRPVWVAVFPLLGWAAWRFEQRAAGPAALIVILFATLAAAHDDGPFAGLGLLHTMVTLQVFNATVSFTSFFFASVVAERGRAEEERRRLAERDREAQVRLYQRERRVAETLQRSLLPEHLPDIPDVEAVARYVPATGEAEVGGDWYDVIPLRDGRIGLGVGDVAGHGVKAAAAMGQVRMAFRAYCLDGMPPARTLESLNRLLLDILPGTMTTLICGRLDPDSGILAIAGAGHPPPALQTSSGLVEYVAEEGFGPPLGVAPLAAYEETEVELAPGSTVVFYTDGLIERRGESLRRGLARLKALLTAAPEDLEVTCDRILGTLLDAQGIEDDIALLAVRRVALTGRPFHLSVAAQPERLSSTRRVLARWLRQNGVPDEDASGVVLACSEACANVIQHAYRARPGMVDVDATISGGAVRLVVRDSGTWNTARATQWEEISRGLSIMREIMDSVDVQPSDHGTSVVMRKRLGGLGPRD